MVQYFKSLGVALLFSVGICSVGNAASFDCNKATTETEITICADRYLSALDELIASAYFEAKRSRNDKQSLIESQRAWILERDVILQNFSKDDEEFLSAQDQLHEILASRLSELLNELTGFDYDTVLNIFNQIEPISLKFEKNKRVLVFSASDSYYSHNIILFGPDHKLVKAIHGEIYWRMSACEQTFDLRTDQKGLSNLVYGFSCGNGGRHGSQEISFEISPGCIQLQTVERSDGSFGEAEGPVGLWKLNDNLQICLEEQNYELNYGLSIDGLVFFKSGESSGFVSMDDWLVFMMDYWIDPPMKSSQAEVASCGKASKMFTQYALSSVRYSDLITEYSKNNTVYDLFLPLIKTVDTDGSVKKWVAKLLTFYDSGQDQIDSSCNVSIIKGDFHRTAPFLPSGFWKRRDLDGTTDQTLEILRKLQKILAD